MIVFTGDDVIYNTVDRKRYDGIYYAIILNGSQASDGINYMCYVYVPEIYGKIDNSHGRLYYRCYDYPRVLIPSRDDACDVDQEPRTGQVVKVSFDDGNINSCRYVARIPIDELYERMNYNYITKGILPAEIITDIKDPTILDKFRELLQSAYYITTGYKDPPAKSFKYKFCWSNTNNAYGDKQDEQNLFRNWFLEALTMPVHSMGAKGQNYGNAIVLPYYSTNIYSLYYVMQDIISTGNSDALRNMYTKMPTIVNFTSPTQYDRLFIFDHKQSKVTDNTTRAKVVATWILGLFSGWGADYEENETYDVALANMAFPELTEQDIYPNMQAASSQLNTAPELLWETSSYADSLYTYETNIFERYRIHYLFKDSEDNRRIYENHYLSVLASWTTAINTFTQDEKFRNIILMCLTIAPWFAAPLLLYSINSIQTTQIMYALIGALNGNNNNVLKDYWNIYIANVDDTGKMEFSSVFPSQDAYIEFRETLQGYLISGNIKGFVNKFENYVNQYLALDANFWPDYYDDKAYAGNDFGGKFARLREVMKLN